MIRKMTDADMDTVLQIWLEGNLQAHPFVSSQYWLAQLEPMRQAYLPNAAVWVYEDEADKLVKGFVGLIDHYIAGLFVLPANQSKGIGGMLLHHCQVQKEYLELHVYCKNKKAVSFYKKYGFQIDNKEIEETTGEEEYAMRWQKKKA